MVSSFGWLLMIILPSKGVPLFFPTQSKTVVCRFLRMVEEVPFSDLFFIFCCPPCPGSIAAKLGFRPPRATYSIDPEAEGGDADVENGSVQRSDDIIARWKLRLTEKACFQYSQQEIDRMDVFMTKNSRGNMIGCMYIRCVPEERFTILFSHGNGEDLGLASSFYIYLGKHVNCNIFSYDYSGYGVSTGKPSEKNACADIDAAWHALTTRYGICPDSIILYGQSIGSVPTVDLASRYECAAVVLHSPLSSGLRVPFPNIKKTYCFDSFTNIDKVSKITSPVLIIHGTEDEVIDFSQALALFERCPNALEPLWVKGGGHNDITFFKQYLIRLHRLISEDLKRH
ncbi:alpha/beta hydrolase domain-containing protein 17A-like [Lissotriton helveticus]